MFDLCARLMKQETEMLKLNVPHLLEVAQFLTLRLTLQVSERGRCEAAYQLICLISVPAAGLHAS